MDPESIQKQLMDHTPEGTRFIGHLEGSTYLIEERNRFKGPKLDDDVSI
jgi:hypothetical protein